MKYLLYLSFFLCTSCFFESEATQIGNLDHYNVKIIAHLKEKKNTEINFDHVVDQKVFFRLKKKVLSIKIFNVKEWDGYVTTGISILKNRKSLYYEFELYRSNGSPEQYLLFDVNGNIVARTVNKNTGTGYIYYKKYANKTFIDNLVLVHKKDLSSLY